MDKQKLKINEIFFSIQCEGPFTGDPAIFIRLSGCNLSCSFCDTNHSTGDLLNTSEILAEINTILEAEDVAYSPLIVVTGGEPLMQPVGKLIELLLRIGYRVQLETNGTLSPRASDPPWYANAFIVCSPKEGTRIQRSFLPFIDAYKILVENNDTETTDLFSFMENSGVPTHVKRDMIYLQPKNVADFPATSKKNAVAAVNLCKKHGFQLSLQTHKTIGIK